MTEEISPYVENLNRCAVIIGAKQPFVDWINKASREAVPDDKDQTEITLEDFNQDDGKNIYLIQTWFDDKEAEKVLKNVYVNIFEEELSGWITDENFWPKKRTYKMFKDWFTIEHQSMVIDLGTESFYYED